MKFIYIFLLTLATNLMSAQSSCSCVELTVWNGRNVTDDLDLILDLVGPGTKICFMTEGDTDDWDSFINITYNNQNNPGFTLDGEQLLIRNRMRLNVNGTITLENNASIIGENNGASRINQLTPGTTLIRNLTGQDYIIRDVQLEAVEILPPLPGDTEARRSQIEDVVGIELGVNSENTTVESVRFNGLLTGIVVDSDSNNFLDLHFFNVGTTAGNCIVNEPANERGAAIILSGSSNEFINLYHNRSGGAVSIWWLDDASENQITNLSVEQELSGCTDPAVFVPNNFLGMNNSCLENFNGAGYAGPNGMPLLSICTYCQSNYSALLNELTLPSTNVDFPCVSVGLMNVIDCTGGTNDEQSACR